MFYLTPKSEKNEKIEINENNIPLLFERLKTETSFNAKLDTIKKIQVFIFNYSH